MSGFGVRRAKAAFSQWVRGPPGYRSSRKQSERGHGGNEMAGASDVTGHFR